MATTIQLLRSDVAQQRPDPGVLRNAIPMVNIHEDEPGLYFTDRLGDLFKVGPVAVGDFTPNSTPQGQQGNSKGELWFDTSGTSPVLKVYDGSLWEDCFPDPGGTVTSVALTLPSSVFSVTGSPVITSGTLTATFSSQTQNTVFVAPDGSNGTPTFRALSQADIPDLSATKITTGQFATGRIPDLDASKITSGTLSSALIPSLDASKISTGTLPYSVGGTGVSSVPLDGELLIGNSALATWSKATLTAGLNVALTNAGGSITIATDADPTFTSLLLDDGGGETLTLTVRNISPASSYSLSFPPADGPNNAVLATNGAGQLSFETSIVGFDTVSADTLIVNNAYTVATLPGPNPGQIARVTDAAAPSIGSAVVGGGAAVALCWYNGTTWTVIGV